MSRIIRRTVTITITETVTIVWPAGDEPSPGAKQGATLYTRQEETMTTNPNQPTRPATIWGEGVFVKLPSTRTAANFASFFLPHLQSGMRLLDCGCGPGTITIGLAPAVAPGEVVGIDLEAAQINLAQTQAAQANVTNIRFEVANVYALPFPDASFDAVYCSAVLGHLRERDKALREMRRVLKPGGLIGVRNDDLDGYLIAPAEPLLRQTWTLFGQFVQHNGGNAWAAKHLRTWLRESGFTQIEMSAAYESYGTPAATAAWSDSIVAILADLEPRLIEAGLTEHAIVERLSVAWQAWGKYPDAFLGRSWCEAVGWVA